MKRIAGSFGTAAALLVLCAVADVERQWLTFAVAIACCERLWDFYGMIFISPTVSQLVEKKGSE